jgi:hypothetical protein
MAARQAIMNAISKTNWLRSSDLKLDLFTLMYCAVLGAAPALAGAGMSDWADRVLAFPYTNGLGQQPTLQVIRQDHEKLEYNRSVIRTPLKIGSRSFEHGLGTHSVSQLRVVAPEPIIGRRQR